MAAPKPTKNPISSAKELKMVCIAVLKNTEADDEAEWSTENDLSEQPLHAVRKVLDRKRLNWKTYYLVDWVPTWEPRQHVAQTLIAGFERKRRALVRKTYIEYEAVEDNTLNRTEV
ncbi:unnamed protein product [Phytophthora fragariaefolia]|uniref:Unnamed protein product n=1 Tax=Phytophthora fragariaefolia TaxID=1490495 RepID=A0A9W7CV39_9STRA|nr:unnamed protein product [Phytophthora fragariaefolia]